MSGQDSLSRKRFLSRSKEEIRNLACDNDSSSTKRCTEYAVRIMRDFCMETGRDQQFETLPVRELDSLLEDFFGNISKKDGTSYQRNGLSGVRYGMARYLRKCREIDITADREFVKSDLSYKARQVELKKSGLGRVNHYLPIKEDDLVKLYGAFDVTDAASLREKVQFDFMFFFSRRDRKNLREMTKDQFIVDTMSDGQRCVRQVSAEQDKYPEQAATDDQAIMLEIPGNQLCPVSTFELYTNKLNPLCMWLWQRERFDIEETDPVWYTNSPIGKNTLASLMPSISQECGLSKAYTNHSVRATSLAALERTIAKIGSQTCQRKSKQSINTSTRLCETWQALSMLSGAVLGTPSPDSVINAPATCSTPLKKSLQAVMQPTSSAQPSAQELKDPLPAPAPAPAPATDETSLPSLSDSEVDSLHIVDNPQDATQNSPLNQLRNHQQMTSFSPNISHSTVNINITDGSKVCSVHFLPDEIKKTLTGQCWLLKDAIPSVFFWGREPQQDNQKASKKGGHDSKDQECNGSESSDGKTVPNPDNDYLTSAFTTDHFQATVQHIEQLKAENLQLRALKFGLSRFSTDPGMIQFYTGFDNYKLFLDTVEVLQPTNYQMRGDPWSAIKIGLNNENLPPIDQFFVFMCRCRAGLLEPDLAIRFGISVATVTGIVMNWTKYLHFVLASLPIWPSRDNIDAHMPGCFKDVNPRMRVILETVEIKCQTSSLHPYNQLYFHRKSSNIFKGLVGMTPCGGVSFLSPLYAGCISLQKMIAHSGLVDKLDENDSVIVARKALTARELRAAKSPTFSVSPFQTSVKKPLFDSVQMKDTTSMGKVQDHVERAIRRVQQYRIFDVAIPPSLADSANQLWTVCCLLTNFREPLS